jgi:hypothetical protein
LEKIGFYFNTGLEFLNKVSVADARKNKLRELAGKMMIREK